jgi:S-adenosylmethionine synthetase
VSERLFTSEPVFKGYSDKLTNKLSESILDETAQDRAALVTGGSSRCLAKVSYVIGVTQLISGMIDVYCIGRKSI